tara:strand:- start:2000 stop:3028 length:1029 start_codon:yes stop_codon:yes gene_type:complete
MKDKSLESIGEFGLIDIIKKKFNSKNNDSLIIGIGDDAAVISKSKDDYFLISSDMLVEGIHFDLTYHPLKHLGYKSVTTNISDIYSMNGFANQITINLGLSNRFSLNAIEEFYKGVKIACEEYNIDLVGGDTTSSKTGLIISVSAIGNVLKNKLTLRKTAKKNDIICVSGDLGRSYIGLQILEREKSVFLTNPEMQPELSNYSDLIEKQLKPKARKDLIEKLSEFNIIPNSMIDISDGLASDLIHLSVQSNLGVKIYEEKLPILKSTILTANELNLNPTTCALNGGEDYELLFSVNEKDYNMLKDNDIDITSIGYFTSNKKCNLVSKEGETISLKAQGWKHF